MGFFLLLFHRCRSRRHLRYQLHWSQRNDYKFSFWRTDKSVTSTPLVLIKWIEAENKKYTFLSSGRFAFFVAKIFYFIKKTKSTRECGTERDWKKLRKTERRKEGKKKLVQTQFKCMTISALCQQRRSTTWIHFYSLLSMAASNLDASPIHRSFQSMAIIAPVGRGSCKRFAIRWRHRGLSECSAKCTN